MHVAFFTLKAYKKVITNHSKNYCRGSSLKWKSIRSLKGND